MFRLSAFRPWLRRRPVVGVPFSGRPFATLGIVVLAAGTSTFILSPTLRLDAPIAAEPLSTVKDSATGVEFPSTLRVPSRFPLPTYTLLGVGVRKVFTLTFSGALI